MSMTKILMCLGRRRWRSVFGFVSLCFFLFFFMSVWVGSYSECPPAGLATFQVHMHVDISLAGLPRRDFFCACWCCCAAEAAPASAAAEMLTCCAGVVHRWLIGWSILFSEREVSSWIGQACQGVRGAASYVNHVVGVFERLAFDCV